MPGPKSSFRSPKTCFPWGETVLTYPPVWEDGDEATGVHRGARQRGVVAMHRQAATQVAKILKGAKVGDIPIEQPNRFEFAVNLRTAKAIGIELPTSTLLLADEVIE